jgi:hypothetical protein
MDAAAVNIPRLGGLNDYHSVEDIAAALDGYERRQIQHAPWYAGGYQPQAAFTMAYSNQYIYLKYYVTEDVVKAEHSKLNDPVFEDSCVEFFIAFDNDESYYNLEFNCMGNSRVQYGAFKTGRAFIPANLLSSIKHQTLIKSNPAGSITWELTLCIPKKVFSYHPALSFQQSTAKVNFYKCGDGLPQPHFLCWNNIESVVPEFHLSRFFKEITFSPQGF